jgi:hypothetical protein
MKLDLTIGSQGTPRIEWCRSCTAQIASDYNWNVFRTTVLSLSKVGLECALESLETVIAVRGKDRNHDRRLALRDEIKGKLGR